MFSVKRPRETSTINEPNKKVTQETPQPPPIIRQPATLSLFGT